MANFTCELYCLLGIRIAASTAYHPQTDGQTEHINQELKQYLRLFVSEHQDNWDDLLLLGEFQYNNHVHSSTQHTPFFLNMGQHLRMGFKPNMCLLTLKTVNEFTDCMKSTLDKAKSAL